MKKILLSLMMFPLVSCNYKNLEQEVDDLSQELAEKENLIEGLKGEVSKKESIIGELENEVSERDYEIEKLKYEIGYLERKLKWNE